MIFGKHINRYYIKHLPILLLGIVSLVMVDYFQLVVPELYRMVINGMNTGFVTVDREAVERFKTLLEKDGINVTIRRSLGRDIEAACGQLRRSAINGEE